MKLKIRFILIIGIVVSFTACKTGKQNHESAPAVTMFKVAVLYPNGDGKTFDMDYYEKKHMPMVAGLLGKNLKYYEIDKGLSGRTPNDKAPFLAIGYFYIEDVAEYNRSLAQNREVVVSDFKNYTNIQPVLQISEVKELRRVVGR